MTSNAAVECRPTVGSQFAVISAVAGGVSLASAAVLNQLIAIGGEACEVYCGPGTVLLPTAIGSLMIVAWVVGAVFFIAGVASAKQRTMLLWLSGLAVASAPSYLGLLALTTLT